MNINQKIKELNEYLASETQREILLIDLESALIVTKGAVVNKNFFEKYFSRTVEGTERTFFTVYLNSGKDWQWNLTYDIGFNQRIHGFKVPSRKTTDILTQTKEELVWTRNRIESIKKQIAQTEGLDIIQIQQDILAVWEKHWRPSVWHEIITDFNIVHPTAAEL